MARMPDYLAGAVVARITDDLVGTVLAVYLTPVEAPIVAVLSL